MSLPSIITVTAHLPYRDITLLIYRADDWDIFLTELKRAAPVTQLSGSLDDVAGLIEGVVCWDIPISVLEKLNNLRWIQTTSSGVDHLNGYLKSNKKKITVSSLKGMNAETVAEFVLLSMLAHKWKLLHFLEQQRAHQWLRSSTSLLSESTCTIIGVGEIGGRVACHARRFGMTVLGVRQSDNSHESVHELFKLDSLNIALARADYVVLSLPLTTDTAGLISEEQFKIMKNSAYLINVSRGAIVNESALLHALEYREISGASLDVTRTEPYPEDGPLWEAPNLILTPHISGQRHDYSSMAAKVWVSNIFRYMKGKQLCPSSEA